MIKKIFGYILIVLSILCGIAIISVIPKTLIEILKAFLKSNDGYQTGKAIGTTIGVLLIALGTYGIWKLGNKLIKP